MLAVISKNYTYENKKSSTPTGKSNFKSVQSYCCYSAGVNPIVLRWAVGSDTRTNVAQLATLQHRYTLGHRRIFHVLHGDAHLSAYHFLVVVRAMPPGRLRFCDGLNKPGSFAACHFGMILSPCPTHMRIGHISRSMGRRCCNSCHMPRLLAGPKSPNFPALSFLCTMTELSVRCTFEYCWKYVSHAHLTLSNQSTIIITLCES
jgi:hypothetical protein